MKKVIRSSSIASEELLKSAGDIYKKAQALLDAIEDGPGEVVDQLDIRDLYDALLEDLPAMNIAINNLSGKKNKPRYEDMW